MSCLGVRRRDESGRGTQYPGLLRPAHILRLVLVGACVRQGIGISVNRETGDVVFICDSYGGYERIAGEIKEKVIQNYIALCVAKALSALNYEVEMEEVKHPVDGKKVLVKGVL